MSGVLCDEMFLQKFLDFISMCEGLLLIRRERQESGTINPFGEGGDLAHGKCDPPIASCIDAVGGSEIGMRVARGCPPWRLPAIIEVGSQYLKLKVENGLKEADLDCGALSGFTALQQSSEYTLHEMLSGEHIGDSKTEGNRGLASVAAKPCKA